MSKVIPAEGIVSGFLLTYDLKDSSAVVEAFDAYGNCEEVHVPVDIPKLRGHLPLGTCVQLDCHTSQGGDQSIEMQQYPVSQDQPIAELNS